ncbi:MAG: hypothetical protein AB7G44_16025 [Bacteroidia bacterium]
MKKIVVVSFLLIYLLSATELHQLVKLPFLVHHYVEHKNKDNQSLAEFLHFHYSTHHETENDYKDTRLPFKSNENCVVISLSAFFVSSPSNFRFNVFSSTLKSYPLYSDNFRSSAFLSSIWQPPKSC